MQEREFLRRDREIGLSNDQFDKVHDGIRDYDFTVDTSNETSFKIAQRIIDFVADNKEPGGFYNMKNKLLA